MKTSIETKKYQTAQNIFFKNVTSFSVSNYDTNPAILVHHGVEIPLPPVHAVAGVPQAVFQFANNGHHFDLNIDLKFPNKIGNIIITFSTLVC